MSSDALRGHLDGLILAVLEQGPRHGYAIMETLQERSDGMLDLPTGSLYPALRRLERAGYVQSAWSTVSGRQRRTYELTSAGRTALGTQRSKWRSFSALIEGILRPDTANSQAAEAN